MTEQFYRDMGDAEVERYARAICKFRGLNPDSPVSDNGYRNAPKVPRWWQYQDRAVDFLAMQGELRRQQTEEETTA